MEFHLVGGFLGSGKTTAIIAAAKLLIAQDKRIGVVTNDQGKYLVDTAFFRAANLPTVEVTGGCFCCNYDDLEARLKQLQQSAWPDVIFAESVGSCADIVATVVKPFLDLQTAGIPLASYTVFTDIRLLRRRLLNQAMPFGDDVVYIFDKQIEEAGLLVVNKTDLLSSEDTRKFAILARTAYPGKVVRLQNSRQVNEVASWVELIRTNQSLVPQVSVGIDYQRYGSGEAELAWLDEAITLTAPQGQLQDSVIKLMTSIHRALREQRLPIGHVKFMIETPSSDWKTSLPSIDEPRWEEEIPPLEGNTAHVLINARVQTRASTLRDLIKSAIERSAAETGSIYQEVDVSSFHPGFPRPTHRMD